jgi:replication-associated recombination protein RarA
MATKEKPVRPAAKTEKPVNYQSQDAWSRTTSVHGHPIDELRSVLQKSIRRGLLEEAMLAGYEIYASGAEAEEMLWRRLEIITTEDIGFGLMNGPAIVEALYAQQKRMAASEDRWMYAAHAIRLLVTAKKDRATMEVASWAKEVTLRGERAVKIEDYHVDMHTRRGVAMGRGSEHWWQEGARLDNRIESSETKYGDYLRALHAGGGKAKTGKPR